jgi:hypothetical protein
MQTRAENPSPLSTSGPASHEPVITSLFPPGVTVGTTTKCVLGGRSLGGVERVWITRGQVEILEQERTADGRLAVLIRTAADAAPGIRELWVEGPAGLSNLVLFRLDTLRSVVEEETNDEPAHANGLSLNAVVSGQLGVGDVDHFQIKGLAGRPVTVEVEARRLGSPLMPIVTLLTQSGGSLIQGRESPGLEGDCRVTSRFPSDGTVIVQVHDALYQSGEAASYRLRVFDTPFATALFPLGGQRGETIEVTASGGSLDRPRRQRIVLPDQAGGVIELKPFTDQGTPLVVPRRLVVGEGPEVVETEQDETLGATTRLPQGGTANGRIAKPGEVDRYLVTVRRGERLRAEIQAASLGSWLDSVLTLRDDQGRPIAENDDPAEGEWNPAPPWSPSRNPFPTDSLLVHQAEADGEWLIEVTDRYGNAGDEYGYRLTVAPTRPDFAVSFAPDLGVLGSDRARGPQWVLNLAPGSTRRIPLRIAVDGRTGPIVLQALSLPPGVTAEPVTIRPRPEWEGGRPALGKARAPIVRAELILRVADNATPVRGQLTVIGTSSRADGSSLSRVATAVIPLHQWESTPPRRPVLREIHALPVKILDPTGSVRPR